MDKQKFNDEVESVLESVRAGLIMHGGNVELVEANADLGEVKVRLHGACAGCPMAEMTLKDVIEAELKEKIPAIKQVTQVF